MGLVEENLRMRLSPSQKVAYSRKKFLTPNRHKTLKPTIDNLFDTVGQFYAKNSLSKLDYKHF